MADEQQRPGGPGIKDGIRAGFGVLNAFKQAIEDTLQEAVDRGDLKPERARQAMRDAAQRVQSTLEETRERLEFVSRKEHEELQAELARLRERVERLETERGGESAAPPGAEAP